MQGLRYRASGFAWARNRHLRRLDDRDCFIATQKSQRGPRLAGGVVLTHEQIRTFDRKSLDLWYRRRRDSLGKPDIVVKSVH